jgi:hypothetical protein
VNFIAFAQEHQAAVTGAGMAIVHFTHLAWPRLAAMFPYCRDNGGAVGIAKQFLFGKQQRAAGILPTVFSAPETQQPLNKV